MKLSGVGYLTKLGWKNIGRNKGMSTASVLILTACFFITGLIALLAVNVDKFIQYLGAQNKVIIYMQLDATDEQIAAAGDVLAQMDNLTDLTFVSKDEALEETKSWISEYDDGAYADVLDGYEGENNPLYASYRATVEDLSELDRTVTRLSSIEGVDFVDAPNEIADTLIRFRRIVDIAGSGVSLVLIVVSLVIVGNSIRITVFDRRKEINIMKFVGATNGFIRWPFLVEGMTVGLIGGLLAFGLLSAAYIEILKLIADGGGLLSSLYFSPISYKAVWKYLAAAFVGSGIVVGGLASSFSARKYMKV